MILDNIVNIDESIWYSSAHKDLCDKTEHGMTEYNINTNQIIQTIEYPEEFQSYRHNCCEYKGKIYMIDGENGQIILFDPVKKQFTKKLDIPAIGKYPSAIVINERVHIFNGKDNTKHLVYNPVINEIITMDDEGTELKELSSITVYNDRIYRFGGFNHDISRRDAAFMMSSKISKDEENVTWTVQSQFELKQPLNKCAYVLYKQYIISMFIFYAISFN